MSPDAASALCRFVHDASLMGLWGAFGYLWALVPASMAQAIARRLRGLRIAATVAAVVTTAVALPIAVARIGDGWASVADLATVRAVLLDTNVGTAWLAQAAGAALLLATLAMRRRRAWKVASLASALPLALLALDGHATVHEGALRTAHRINDVVHVLAAGAWFGALVALVPVMALASEPAWRQEAGFALRRFSAVGHAIVAVVLASGAVNTMLVLGSWPTDLSSPYQGLLAAKIAAVLLMTGLALVNRYGLVPRLGREPLGAARALRIGTLVEVALGLVAIGLVSLFGLLEPS